MDTYENENLGIEPENTQPVPETPTAPQEPAAEQEPSWNPGATRKESPFADSPYVMNSSAWQTSQPPRKEKKKGSGKVWKSIVAAVLVVVLVAGSCGITAYSVNSYWQNRTDSMSNSFDQKLNDLQSQINANSSAGTGNSVSGSPVVSEGLTPSQVYAQCKMSVVAISCMTNNASSSGSGFILSEDGYVVTNYHVIQGASAISVITYDGQEYTATVKGSNSTNDLAVLKVEAEGLQPATIGSSNDLIIGDMVVAIGNPLGELSSTQTVGYISGKDREVNTDGTVINMLQTDAAINPGNSGGPLFNMKGEVVGITTAKYSGTTSSGASIEGIGFAIPIDDVAGMIDDIVNLGYVTGAYLGIYVKDVEESAQYYGVPAGAYVDSVNPGSCAEKAGIQAKDIIVSLGGQRVESVNGTNSLSRALRNFKAGDTASVVVYRGGREVALTVTFDQKPQDTTVQQPEQEPQLPSSGSYEDWYDFFFGDGIG